MRILMFAFACDPDRGSEPGAGFVLAEAASLGEERRVHVITRNDPGVADRLRQRLGSNVTVWAVDSPGSRSVYLNYFVWILRASRVAVGLRRREHFDVVHHATYASDWFVNPLHLLRKREGERWVWGPAGGATYPPLRLLRRALGGGWWRDIRRMGLTSLLRIAAQRLLRGRVDAVLALNDDSARSFDSRGFLDVGVTSNLVIDYDEIPLPAERSDRRLVWASRAEPWKGLWLALDAFSQLPEEWEFVILGGGTDGAELRDRVHKFEGRVRICGSVPRATALDEIRRATALILPSLHDSAPWVAGEAGAMAVPVVCLELGGVATMAGPLARVVDSRPTRTLVARIAEAVQRVSKEQKQDPSRIHTRQRLREALDTAYGAST